MAKQRERNAAGTSAAKRESSEEDRKIETLIVKGNFYEWEDMPADVTVYVGKIPHGHPDLVATGHTTAGLRASQWRELHALPPDTEITIFRMRRS